MGNFTGFYGDTADVLRGIRINNNKEWFEYNREFYKQYVHEPMTLLGNDIFERMEAFDNDFDAAPSVSRAMRNGADAKGEAVYADSKRLMLQTDPEAPAYFFEVSPEGYRYGLGYWPGAIPCGKAAADGNEARRVNAWFTTQTTFKLEAGIYELWNGRPYKCRYITFVRYMDFDQLFVQQRLLDVVAAGYKSLYPMYLYYKRMQKEINN